MCLRLIEEKEKLVILFWEIFWKICLGILSTNIIRFNMKKPQKIFSRKTDGVKD